MSRILIVDDEKLVRELICKYALFEGHSVTMANDGAEAVAICKEQDFDVIVIDIMMPKLDGFSVCREIRKLKDTPIIMLSARGEEYDRIHGFELGVDDYLVKPFSPRELMLRIDVIVRRNSRSKEKIKHEIVKIEDLTIDFSARRVTIDGQALEMTPREYDLLFYIVKNRGIALTRERLIHDVWRGELLNDDRTLDTHIKCLRHSLRQYSRCIVTLRGVGYRFEEI